MAGRHLACRSREVVQCLVVLVVTVIVIFDNHPHHKPHWHQETRVGTSVEIHRNPHKAILGTKTRVRVHRAVVDLLPKAVEAVDSALNTNSRWDTLLADHHSEISLVKDVVAYHPHSKTKAAALNSPTPPTSLTAAQP